MAKRKSISKTTRFEVFKRDSFTCQYCGRSAPDVVLEVDHIVPVAEGGTNDILNLITSCKDCNRGKGKKKLSDDTAIKKQKAQLDLLNERREQIEMMAEWKKGLLEINEAEVNYIQDIVEMYTGCTLTDSGRIKVKQLIRKFGIEEVETSTEIAFEQYYNPNAKGRSRGSSEFVFDKIGGICYNRKNGITAEMYREKHKARWNYGKNKEDS